MHNSQPTTEQFWQGRLCSLLANDDHELAAKTLSAWLDGASPQERYWIQDNMNDVYWFFNDSPCKALGDLFESARTDIMKLADRDAIFESRQGALAGLILRRGERENGVVFLPDASEPGRVRYSAFDAKGFYEHMTFDSYQEALEVVWQDGYRTPMPESWFVELSTTPTWKAGMEQTHKIAEHNFSTGPGAPRRR